MKQFEKLHIYCQKVLPTVYDNSLSYYEAICKLSYIVNELIETINNEENDYTSYVDSQISILKNYVDSENENIYNYFTNLINDSINNSENYILTQLYKLQLFLTQEINNLDNKIDYEIANLQGEFTIKFNEFKKEIEKIINDNNILIFNPLTGNLETVEKTVNDIYNSLRYEAFTCIEFDTSDITCSMFDNSGITCKEFDVKGKTYFHKNKCDCIIRDYTTGKIENIETVLANYIAQSYNNVTCAYFDSLELTAEEYDNKLISAYDFNFKPNIL